MKSISIRELHTRTGHYVRRAATEPITVTDRGEAIGRLVPLSEPAGLTFVQRRLRPGFKRLMNGPLMEVKWIVANSSPRTGIGHDLFR